MRCSISLHSSHDCGSFFPDGSCSRVIFTSPLHTLLGICVHCSGEITSWTSHYENVILGIPFLYRFFKDTHDDINHWYKYMPTRSALTLETKDSFISLLTNLNDKNNMAAIPLYSSIMSVAWLSSDLFRGSRGFKPPAFLTLHSWLPPYFSYLPPLAFFRMRHI